MEKENVIMCFDPGAPEGDKTVETTVVATLPPEQRVILVGCMNPKMIKSVVGAAKRNDVEIVMLDDKVVTDYLNIKGVKTQNAESVTLEKFLSDSNNRITAEQQAAKLWAVLTGKTDVEKAEETEFTETQVCRMTTLSHSKANALFNLLRAFGLMEWTDLKKRAFKLHFDKSFCYSAIQNDILAVSKTVNNDILRYKKAIEADEKIDEKERKRMLAALKDSVLAAFEF